MIEPGRDYHQRGATEDGVLSIHIEDTAGLYRPTPDGDGLGMNLVDRRIKIRYGAHPLLTAFACNAESRTLDP